MRSFASDNNSGVHPRVMDAIIKANDNHAVGYGDDPWTEAATSKIQEVFGKDAIKRTGHGLQGHGVRPRPVKHEKRRSILAEHFLYLTRSGLCPRMLLLFSCLTGRGRTPWPCKP